MTAKRLNLLLMGALALLIVALLGSTYGVSKMLQAKSVQLANNRADSAKLSDQQADLIKSKQDIARYADLEKITKSIVPQDKDQAQAVREITNIASANDISLTTISFPSSTLGATKVGGVSKTNLSQLTPVSNIPGVYNLQITVGNNPNNTVSFNQLDSFLRGLENNRRTAAVSSLSIQPQANSANRLVFTLVINTFIKPS